MCCPYILGQFNLAPVVSASHILGRHLKPGSIVVYESTVFPGATEEVCLPILEQESGLKCGVDFWIGYSPERINPGDKVHRLENIKIIVSGICGVILFRIYDPFTKMANAARPAAAYAPYSTETTAPMTVDGDSSVTARQLIQDSADVRETLTVESDNAFTAEAKTLLTQSVGRSADIIDAVYTTKRAVAFLFSGFGDSMELDGVLAALKDTGSIGQFFVTTAEAKTCETEIRKIITSGMRLGIAFRGNAAMSAQDYLAGWLETASILHDFGYRDEIYLLLTDSSEVTACFEAAAAGDFCLIRQRMEAIPAEAVYAKNAQAVIDTLFPNSRRNLQRGESVHFRMNYLQGSPDILGEVVRLMATEKSNYPVIPMSEILADESELYTYPLPEESILPEVKDAIYPGQLGEECSFEYLRTHYYGASWVNSFYFLPGFTREEVRNMDKKGVLYNEDHYLFLTFDDWGTDASIEPLLQVLAKHDAKAAFFIRTNNVPSNPNLLRAIAKDGHAVGSHTDSHFPLSNATDIPQQYKSLTDEQVTELQADLVKSYQVLQSIIGDITISNGPALTKIFRPPTLAMSRNGLFTVLDCGFSYSVSGSGEAEDFRVDSVDQLVQELRKDTKNGAIIILHMFENAPYTAEALDIYMTEMEARGYCFVTLSEVLK